MNFPYKAIAQCSGEAIAGHKGSGIHYDNLTTFFGTSDWCRIALFPVENEPRWKQYIELYKAINLKPFYHENIYDIPIRTDRGIIPCGLLYASKNPTAKKVVSYVMSKEKETV